MYHEIYPLAPAAPNLNQSTKLNKGLTMDSFTFVDDKKLVPGTKVVVLLDYGRTQKEGGTDHT